MDLHTIIIGVIFLLICLIPVLITSRNKKKKEAQFVQLLFALAERNNCKISNYEQWNDSVLGIDEVTNFVFIINKIKEVETIQQIHLAEIQKCRVMESSRTVGEKGATMKAVDKIELAFINRDRNKVDTIVTFYNSDYDRLTLNGEIQMAEKWCKIANDSITAITK